MRKRENGGYAFPSYDNTDDSVRGMNLRDYFIAHAPAEPQPWFEPVMKITCPEPIPYPSDETAAERAEINRWMQKGGIETVDDSKEPRARAYVHAREEHARASFLWDAEHTKQRYVQWPAAWADEMLKQS